MMVGTDADATAGLHYKTCSGNFHLCCYQLGQASNVTACRFIAQIITFPLVCPQSRKGNANVTAKIVMITGFTLIGHKII